MQQVNGLLSKISDNQYRLLTMDGEMFLEGNLALQDGFYSDMDLSNIEVRKNKEKQLVSSGTFTSVVKIKGNDCSDPPGVCTDCACDCACECDCKVECDCACDCECDCQDCWS